MKPLLETLVDRGHSVTVLVPSTSMFMSTKEPARFHYLPFNVSVSLEDMENYLEELLHFSMYEMDYMNYFQIYKKFIDLMEFEMSYSLDYLDGVVKSETTMKKLKEGHFDLLLSDPIYPGSDLVADILGLPLVLSLRFSMVNNWERYCGQLPSPPSFVPASMSKLTDKMDFFDRVWNFLFYALNDVVLEPIYWTRVDKYYSEVRGKHNTPPEDPLRGLMKVVLLFSSFNLTFGVRCVTGTPTNGCQLMGRADIWLIRTYWDFEFPRPFLPNFKFVGGIHCRPAKPLPKVGFFSPTSLQLFLQVRKILKMGTI